METYIIIVASYNYRRGSNYNNYVDRRKNLLLHQNPSWGNDEDVKFVHFDVKNGKIKENRVENGSRAWHTINSSFDAIDHSQHYEGTHFKSQDTNVLSISDLYDFIHDLGSSSPGSVKEVSILGHSWHGGPLFVNSFQRGDYSSGSKRNERDPWDRDGRTKDFNRINMSSTYWSKIRRAFKTDGYFWIWGCLFSRMHYTVLNKLIRSQEYRAKRLGQHHDNDIIQFSFSSRFVNKYYDHSTFFPSNKSTRRFSKTIKDVKRFLETGMLTSYPGKIAGDLGINCYAALIGTYSIYESSNSSRFPLMKIADGGVGHGANFTKHIQFYKTYMNIDIDPENKKYGKYKGDLIMSWWDRYIS